MDFKALIQLSILLFSVVELLKTPILKPAAQRLSLSDDQYKVVIHALVGILGAFIVFSNPSQWNALTWAEIYGYPVWAGNLVAVVFIAMGDIVAHGAWDFLKNFSTYLDRREIVG